MPGTFLGVLQKRDPWSDVFTALQPTGQALAQHLAGRPGREKQILAKVWECYQKTDEKGRAAMEGHPDWPKVQTMFDRNFPGLMVGGKLIVAPPTMEQQKAGIFGQLPPEEQRAIVTGKKGLEPKQRGYAYAFEQVQSAIERGETPNPTWLKVIEAYIKPEPGKELTGKDKVVQDTWKLIKEDLYAGRGVEPWQWKIVGGYVTEEKLSPMEQAYKDVYAKYQGEGIEALDDIEKAILKYHPTEPGPMDAIKKKIWEKTERGETLTDIETAIISGIKPEVRAPKEEAFEQVWNKYLRKETLTDIDRGIIGAALEKKTELTPKQRAFNESWTKYKMVGEEALTDIDKAQLGITPPPPKKEETIQDQAYRKAYERLKGNLALSEFDRAILGIPLKKPEEIKGKERILDSIASKYLRNEELTPEEWDLLGVTPKAEPTAKEGVVEWAFDRVKKAMATGQDPNPSDLQIIGGYVKGGPEETITARIKAWAFEQVMAGRGKPELWKIIGGYVAPTAPVKSELKTINGDLWLINAVTGEKRRILKGQVDKQKTISEAFKEALAYTKGKWPGYWERSLSVEEQKRWDKDFRLQWHKNLLTRGFSGSEARKIVRPSDLAAGQEGVYTPTLTPEQRKLYNMVVNEAKGDREKIKRMQQNLVNWGVYTGVIDGVLGKETREALYNAVQQGLVREKGR